MQEETSAPPRGPGRRALVTGASTGLGRHFATTLAGAGAKVAAAARRTDLLDALVTEITDQGGTALAVALDVTDGASVAVALDQTEAALGPVSVVVNNAGLAIDKKLDETADTDWDAVLDTNLRGAKQFDLHS